MTSYDPKNAFDAMSADTRFAFNEGHIRLLLLMCEQQAEQLESCVDEALRNDEQPSDTLLNVREGVYDLKVWAMRLLDQLEYDEDDEMEGEEEDLDEAIELQSFREDLILRSQVNRVSARSEEQPNPLQKLRLWILSLCVRFLASPEKS